MVMSMGEMPLQIEQQCVVGVQRGLESRDSVLQIGLQDGSTRGVPNMLSWVAAVSLGR